MYDTCSPSTWRTPPPAFTTGSTRLWRWSVGWPTRKTAWHSGEQDGGLRAAGNSDKDDISKEQFVSLRKVLQEDRSAGRSRRDRTGQRLQRLAQTTGLSRTDITILELLVRHQTNPVFESLIDDVFVGPSPWHELNIKGRALSLLLGISASAVARRFGNDAPLVRAGLVSIDNDGDLRVIDRLNRIALAPAEAGLDVNRLLMDAAPRSELDWSDFDHVAGDRDHVEMLLKGALERQEPGVNILLYGPPGTGQDRILQGGGRTPGRHALLRRRVG